MRVMISGASGLVGGELARQLAAGGHEVTRLVRREAGAGELRWDPQTGQVEKGPSSGIDALVHLAGENIAAQRWNADFKRRIRDSRVDVTRRLCDAVAQWDRPPQTLISASAIGYYGDRGDERLEENSRAGSGFLAEVARDWEEATQPAAAAGIRVVLPRLGVVLSPTGGALAKMLPIFRFGGGGVVGTGRQYWSWISLDDAVSAICHLLACASVSGPVNVVAPHAVTNAEFTRILATVLGRPAVVPLPAFAARWALGEMADGLLLASARVEPKGLVESGFEFHHPTLEAALRSLLKG